MERSRAEERGLGCPRPPITPSMILHPGTFPCWPCPSPSPPAPAPSRWDYLAHHPCCGNRPSGWTANLPDPAPCMPRPSCRASLTSDPARPGVHPLRGATERLGGTTTFPPQHSAPGEERTEEHSEPSTHTAPCCVLVLPLVECPPSPGQHRCLRVCPVSASLHLPGRPPPLKSWRERATSGFTFQAGQLQPHVALWPGESERLLFVSATRGQAPTRPDGCTTGSSRGNRGRGHWRPAGYIWAEFAVCWWKNFQASFKAGTHWREAQCGVEECRRGLARGMGQNPKHLPCFEGPPCGCFRDERDPRWGCRVALSPHDGCGVPSLFKRGLLS